MSDAKAIEDVRNQRPELPKIVNTDENHYELRVQKHGDLQELFRGSGDAFGTMLIEQLFDASGFVAGSTDIKGHAMLIASELNPRDTLESLLISQMAVTHLAIMRHAKKMAEARHVQQLDLQERIYNKLTRTFTTQMEALRKHRTGGKQTVTVQHVKVEDGGQAIVGNVNSRKENKV